MFDEAEFEWDKGNIDKNTKHNIANNEAEEVFFDKGNVVLDDNKHSTNKETRHMILGRSKQQRKLSVIFTIRKSKIRIISARDMNKKERRSYEENTKV